MIWSACMSCVKRGMNRSANEAKFLSEASVIFLKLYYGNTCQNLLFLRCNIGQG